MVITQKYNSSFTHSNDEDSANIENVYSVGYRFQYAEQKNDLYLLPKYKNIKVQTLSKQTQPM